MRAVRSRTLTAFWTAAPQRDVRGRPTRAPARAQAAAVCLLDVSSTVALQLPALQGALAKSFGLYAAFLAGKGAPVPAGAPEAAALAATAALWGAAFYAYYAATAEEVEVTLTLCPAGAPAAGVHRMRGGGGCQVACVLVRAGQRRGRGDAMGKAALCSGRFRALHRGPRASAQVVDAAVANADRYYRLVAMGMASRSGDAEWEAALFKAAAAAWLAEKKANSRLNALLQIFEARGPLRPVLPCVGRVSIFRARGRAACAAT
jgi:hypothetical protein